MWLNILETCMQYDYLLEIIIVIAGWLIGFFSRKFTDLIKRNKLKKILSLNKAPSNLILPIRKGYLRANKGTTSIKSEYITFDETKIILEVTKYFNEINDKYTELRLIDEADRQRSTDNFFYFGSYLVHDYVRQLFKDRFHMIKFTCGPNVYNKSTEARDMLIEVTGGKREVLVNGVSRMSYNRFDDGDGIVMLIKLTGAKNFSDKKHGTVHICWGDRSENTLAAARAFTDNRHELYRHLKKHKDNYMVLIKCTKQYHLDFNFLIDLTDEVFTL